jgi:glycoside/pentoside/hexuronide:cation symporter, GPH family
MADVHPSSQKLSFVEKAGYSAADAAANFVFMTMVLFQTSPFYQEVFGISAFAAGAILLIARLWDAFADPIVGVLADRTNTRWGKFRPWILFTAIPWCVVMVLAYTTPRHLSPTAMIVYAAVTNILLMSLYSMNNMPYSALGGVMTGDVNERASLNSYRFVSVNIAQFIVGGFTLPLVAKFADSYASQNAGEENLANVAQQYGWQMTMTIWAVVCLFLFLITFFTTKERIQPPPTQKSSPWQDFSDLLSNNPWKIMFLWTLVHFCILSFRGAAQYNYYQQYADKGALYDFVSTFHLTAPKLAPGTSAPGGILEFINYIVHGDKADVATDPAVAKKAAGVAFSIIQMLNTLTIIIVILLSASLSRVFGKKTVCVVGFAGACLATFAFYWLKPTDVWGMLALTLTVAVCYAPTIPLTWAIFADVADFSEWKNGRRATGIVFATIGFALKSGLALGSAAFLWIMAGVYHLGGENADPATIVNGYRVTSTLMVGVLFAICTFLLMLYPLGKRTTIQMADELAERREKFATA